MKIAIIISFLLTMMALGYAYYLDSNARTGEEHMSAAAVATLAIFPAAVCALLCAWKLVPFFWGLL